MNVRHGITLPTVFVYYCGALTLLLVAVALQRG